MQPDADVLSPASSDEFLPSARRLLPFMKNGHEADWSLLTHYLGGAAALTCSEPDRVAGDFRLGCPVSAW
jgi:hypothetical protein